MDHPYALRTPWYVRLRDGTGSFDDAAKRPAIQKYTTADYVDVLMADPRNSVTFDPVLDLWSYPVPVGFPGLESGRKRFATHRMVTTPIRKLYQPNHDRFYALTIELFCDEPGLPRPGQVDGLELRFVIRRERLAITGGTEAELKTNLTKARTLARDLTAQLFREQIKRPKDAADIPDVDDLDRIVAAQRAANHAFTSAQAATLAQVTTSVVAAWTVSPGGRGAWTPVDVQPGEPPELAPHEQELPMWRLPPRRDDCAAGRTRSLWFGLVPTFSGDIDTAGEPRFDDGSIYRIWCFARKQPAPGHEHCPPKLFWSDASTPYRLASFYDPVGTSNRRFSIAMPDFRALAAQAGEEQGPGGVEVVRPPGSQLKFVQADLGDLPKETRTVNGRTDFGSATSRCTFALELLMIVAMFVFSIFLPIVVLLFQLWWLLLLRFCWPPNQSALTILNAHLNSNGTIETMNNDAKDALDEVVEVRGAATELAKVNHIKSENATAKALVASSQPEVIPTPADPEPETKPVDPLCRPDAPLP